MIRKKRLISTILAIMLMLSMVLDTVSCIPMHLHTHHADSSTGESGDSGSTDSSNEDLYFNADGSVKVGTIIEGDVNCTHSWGKYERNTETHIQTCTKCGRVESEAHVYPTQNVMVGSDGEIYKVVGWNTDGTPIQDENKLTYKFLGFITRDVDFSYLSSNLVNYFKVSGNGYGSGLQSAVFLKEKDAGKDYNGDGDMNDVLGDAQYHYQSCLVCSQIRKVAHDEDRSGQFVKDGNGWFCLGCFCGHNQDSSDSNIINQTANKKDPAECNHLYPETMTGTNGFAVTAGTSAYELVGYDHDVHVESCYLCGAIRAQAHTWERTYTDGDGNTTYYCSRGCQSILEGEHFVPDVCIPETGSTESPHSMVTVNAKAPTCTETGYSAHQKCEDCEYVIDKEIYDTLPHATHYVEGQDATCTAEGFKAHYKCQNCDFTTDSENSQTFVAVTVLAKSDHTEVVIPGKAATCTETGLTEGKKCSVCNEVLVAQTVIELADHKFTTYTSNNDATCAADGTKTATCDNGCGATDTVTDTGSRKEHVYDGGVVTTLPTCNNAGVRTYTCTLCGSTKTEIEDATGVHNYTSVVTAPTCTTDGYTTYTCSFCGNTYTGNTVDKYGHDLDAGVVTKKATCTEDGVMTFTCQRAGCSHTETQTIEKLSHAWTDVAEKNATCFEDGYTAHQVCSACGETQNKTTISKDTVAHNYTDVVYSWTKTGEEYTACKAIGTCSVCGEQASVTVEDTLKDNPADGFNVITPVHSDCQTEGSTTYEVDFTSVASWAGTTSTTVVNPLDSEKHTPGDPVEENVIEASCTVDGHKEIVVYCEKCGHEITRTVETTPKLGHNEVVDERVEATCTATGLTEGTHCSRCDEVLVAQTVIPVKEHTAGDIVIENNVDPTCTTAGSYNEVVYCEVCNEKLSTNKVVVDKTEHTLQTIPAVAPTCTATGLSEGKSCSVCHQVIVAQSTVAALGHNWDSGVVTTNPTCTEKGVKTYTCQHDASHKYTEEVAALGHNLVDVAGKAATCTEAGFTAHKDCSRCDYVEGKNTIAAHGHSYETYKSNEDATCTADGTKTATCENGCGTTDTVTDVGSKKDHTIKSIDESTARWDASFASCTVTAICDGCGATFSATASGAQIKVETIESSTCIGAGAMKYTATFSLSNGTVKKVEKTVATAAQGHIYSSEVQKIPETCTEQGYSIYTCTKCGAIMTDKYVDPKGHKYTNYVPDNNATCTSDGTKTATCDNGCGTTNTVTNTGSKLEHTYNKVVTAPTCTAQGYTTHTCSQCSDSYVDTYVDAKGHTEVTVPGKAATCTATGLTDGTKCSVCGETLVAQTVVDALSHTEVTDEAVAPTCENTGLTEGKHCSVCNKVLVAQNPVAALGHTVVIDASKAPTCTESGLTEGKHCSVCNEVLVAQQTVPVKAHTPGTAATCTTAQTCTVCGTTLAEKLGHSEVSHEAKAPTCTEKGWDSYVTCSRCSYTTYSEKAALGHNYNSVVTDPTCTEDGYTTHTCSRCENSYVDTYVDAKGHTEITIPGKAATCTETGLTAGTKCSVCGETLVAQTEIPVLGHKDENKDHVCDNGCDVPQGTHKAADGKHTCDYCGKTVTTCADNNNDHNCDVCDKVLSECADNNNDHNCDICKSELTQCSDIAGDNNHSCDICGKENITEHTYSAWAPTGENQHIHTCAECSATETGACSDAAGDGDHLCDACDRADVTACSDVTTDKDHNCDECDAENVTAHSYSESWSYDDDTHWHECNCGSKSDEAAHNHSETVTNETHHWTVCECGHTTTAEAHSYTSEVTTDPTCTEKGVKTYTCSCGKSYTEVIDPLGHIDEVDDNLCDRCGASLCGTNDHKWNDGVITTPPTCTEAGVKTYTCSACKDTKTESVDALNHAYGEATYNWSADGKSCTATRTCKNDASHTETATAEITSKVKTPATCEGKGTTTYTATFKEAWATAQTTDVVDIPAAGHKWNEAWANNETSHWHECDNCDATNGTADHTDAESDGDHVCDICDRADVSSHVYDNACDANCNDCRADRTPADHVYTNNCDADCNVCGATRTPSAHVYDNACDTTCNECEAVREITHNYSESWSKDGSNHWHECSVCGDKKDKTPHSYETEVIAPTCETKGYTIYTCSVCEHKYTGNETSATGHNYSVSYEWNGYGECTATRVCENNAAHTNVCTANISTEVTKEATCTETGIRTYTATFREAWATTQTSTEVIEKLPHAYDHACDTTCNSCGETRVTAHTYGDWVSNGDKTHTHTCTVVGCGNTETEVCSDVTTDKDHNCDECSAAGITEHVYESAVTKAPTCTEAGVKTYTCNCGHSYTESIDMVAHVYENQVAEAEYLATAATCTESAVYYKSCDCGAKGEEKFTYGNPLGHMFTNYVSNNDATCTENGTETAKCDRCDVTDTVADEGSKLGHKDENKDHDCDNGCEVYQGEHTDSSTDKDHVCDYGCGVVLEACSDKTGDGDHKCDICGKADVTDHTYGNATCDAPATCTECGATTGSALGHAYGEPVYTWNGVASCTATRSCGRCDNKETATAVITSEVTTNPTCTEKGAETYTAEFTENWAEMQTKVVEIDALGHVRGEAVIENNVLPTCTSFGSYDSVVNCTRCKTELSRTKVTVPKLDHTAGEVVVENKVEATCTADGSYDNVVRCTKCNTVLSSQTVIVHAKGHTAGEAVIENNVLPTCTADGSYDKVVYCTVCDTELRRDTFVVDMLGHKDENKDHVCDNGCSEYQGAHLDGDDHDHLCDYGCGDIADDGCYDNDDKDHNCDECYAIIEGHTAGEAVKENIIDATCTADGHYDSVVYCVECDAEISRDIIVINRTGHKRGEAVKENVTNATCTAEGSYESVIYCIVCDAELKRDVVTVPMIAHTAGEAVVENYKAPSCVDDGHYDSVVYCVVCSEKLSSEEITINSLGHTSGNTVIENYKDATCTAEGTYDSVVYCVVCREELSRVKVEIPLLNHTFGEVVVENNINPTCITEGSYDFVIYCTECNAELVRDRYTVNRIGHIWGNPVVENEVLADCENAGSYDNAVYCRVCEKEVSRETVIIDAHGHTSGETVVENIVDPTCTHDGSYDNVIYCTTCDDELSRKTMVVDSHGHKRGAAVKENEIAPDCTHDGSYDSVVYCDTCNEELSRKTVTVDAFGHNAGRKVEENKISPDCENPGSYENVVYCKDCGEELSRQLVVLNPLGHDYNRGECDDCGAEDPDYVEPQPPVEDEDSDKNGWNDFFSNIIEMIVNFLNQFLNAIVSLYRSIADFLVIALNTVFKAILGFFKYLSALFKSIFTA